MLIEVNDPFCGGSLLLWNRQNIIYIFFRYVVVINKEVKTNYQKKKKRRTWGMRV